ncbi:MAG: CHAT domain-containing protein [Leptolyngbya sp. SIOISBB]|nr:CHAT domain-containing protein [Leptolyngbya sp. SIOISBB]
MYSLLRRFLIRRLLRMLFVCSLILALVIGHPLQPGGLGTPAIAQEQTPAQLVQSGVEAYQQADYRAAIAVWAQALAAYPADANAERAIVHENLARVYQQVGETQAAIASWEAAAADYQAIDNSTQFGRMLTEQAQVYITLGQYQRAAVLLCGDAELDIHLEGEMDIHCVGGAYAIAVATTDPTGQATALGSLAETYRLQGDYETAESILKIGLDLVNSHEGLAQYQAAMLNSLGNTYARWSQFSQRRAEASELVGLSSALDVAKRLQAEADQKRTQALKAFTEAVDAAVIRSDVFTEMRSQLSLVFLSRRNPVPNQTDTAAQERLAQLIVELPLSRDTAYAAITLAKSYYTLAQDFACPNAQARNQIIPRDCRVKHWLEIGLQIADRIEDDRAQSFALGELGHLAECQQNWEEAAHLTHQAQLAASHALESADSLYLWEWQMGRIHNQQEQTNQAIASYKQAIATLEDIRTDILTADRDLQFDFRDTVEPIYRQYIALLLTTAQDDSSTKQVSPIADINMAETLQAVDALRLAELQNFFGDDCVLIASTDAREQLLANDPQTAVITSVVLEDRTVLLANLPDGTDKIFFVGETPQLRALASDFRRTLKRFRDFAFDLSSSESLYQQLIADLDKDLERTQTKTLVFVQDGFLRNIPMAALWDGDEYLIQKYAIATTPALGLTAPRSNNRDFRALAVGLNQEIVTESGRSFNDLGAVPEELNAISEQLPGSRTLLNEEFTVERLKEALQENSYPILHLATHGQFSTVPEETFVITGPNNAGLSEEITFNQLEAILNEFSLNDEPLELITLTACQTATGDDRATLGLAGVAIQAGARSAIASLWNLDDNIAATLIPNFYRNLRNPDLSKAQALQAAQVDALEANSRANPGRWAPLILVGNWQ